MLYLASISCFVVYENYEVFGRVVWIKERETKEGFFKRIPAKFFYIEYFL